MTTIESDWGDWLPRAIATATPSEAAVWYLGCNGAVIKAGDGTTIFIDPYLGTGDPPRTVRSIPVPFAPTDIRQADAVLITHEHTDHLHAPTQGPILAKHDATLFGPGASIEQTADWPENYDIEEEQLVTVTEGDHLEVGTVTVTVEGANDPDAVHPVSYVFEFEDSDQTVFHGGDARPGAPFETIGERYDIDLGFLAFGSAGMIPDKETGTPQYTKWYNNENELIKAATQLQLTEVVPTHWDMWRGLTADPTALHEHARRMPYPDRLRIVEMGDRIDCGQQSPTPEYPYP